MKIFLTGVTGFLGGELLIELSKLSHVEKIFCLVRADNQLLAQERLKKVFSFHDDFYDESKVVAVTGNLMDDSLAVKLAENPGLDQINIVIHSGANTSFLPQKKDVIAATNVNGAVQIATWAAGLKKLETFAYVGTAMIAGAGLNMVGKHIFEDESPNPNSEHLVDYTYLKMIGEMKVREIIPKEKLLIVRPSAILGDSRPWKPRAFDIVWIFSALNILRLCPFDSKCKADVVPVDYASKAIIDLVFSNRSFSCYHISSGASASTMWDILSVYRDCDDIVRPSFCFTDQGLIEEIAFFSRKRIERCNILNNDYTNYLDYWRKEFQPFGKLRILLYGLDKYLKFINVSQTFDNSRLISEGIAVPEFAGSYVKRTMPFIKNIDVIESSTKNA